MTEAEEIKWWKCCLECPTCGAKEGKPCRTPKGRKKETAHDTRPFVV